MRSENRERALFFTPQRLNLVWPRTLVGWSEEEPLADPPLAIVHLGDRDATIRETSAIATGHLTAAVGATR